MDYLITCKACGFTFTVADKTVEAREKEYKRVKEIFGEHKFVT
jgi:hypothetical protein